MKHVISVEKILGEALSSFQQMVQWAADHRYYTVAEECSRADELIRLVEVYDCGSIGGFSPGQRKSNASPMKYIDIYVHTYARWRFLVEKYGCESPVGAEKWEKEIESFFRWKKQ